jgi:hypothetical protein
MKDIKFSQRKIIPDKDAEERIKTFHKEPYQLVQAVADDYS